MNVEQRRAIAAAYRKAIRNWKPRLEVLCPAAPQVKNRAPSATKKGPGRVSLSLVRETRRKPDANA